MGEHGEASLEDAAMSWMGSATETGAGGSAEGEARMWRRRRRRTRDEAYRLEKSLDEAPPSS